MADGCLYFRADARPRAEPPAGGFKPLYGLWLELAERVDEEPVERLALKRALGWTASRFRTVTYHMRLAGIIAGKEPVRLTARGQERLRQAMKE